MITEVETFHLREAGLMGSALFHPHLFQLLSLSFQPLPKGTLIDPMPPTYLCQRCTACCRWPGFVRVTQEEIQEIASFLKMDEDLFIQDYTRLRPNRGGLALIDQENGACFFCQETIVPFRRSNRSSARISPTAGISPDGAISVRPSSCQFVIRLSLLPGKYCPPHIPPLTGPKDTVKSLHRGTTL